MTKKYLFVLVGLLAAATVAGCRSAHTTAAILYIDEQKYDKAINAIHEGFQYRDNEPDAYFYLGESYGHKAEEAVDEDNFVEAKKNYELAYEAYSKTLELDAKDWSDKVAESLKYNYGSRLRQAKLDWDDEYYEQAEGQLRLAYAALPDSVTPIKSIARMKIQMANQDEFADQKEELLDQALALLDQVLAEKPEAYDLRLDKASVLDALGRNDEAKDLYHELLAEHGNDTHLLLNMAMLAQEQGDYLAASDFYVKVVDLNEADTDGSNDEDNKSMLVQAGIMYGSPNVKAFDKALAVLDRAANMESSLNENTMLLRLQTYNNYGMDLMTQATDEVDPARQQEIKDKAKAMFERAVEIGVAMTSNFPLNAQGFYYLSSAQFQLGDYNAADANNKVFEELSATSGQ